MERSELIADAIRLIQFPSVLDETNPDYPFGEANYACLAYFSELCAQAGLKVHLDETKKFAFADTEGPIEVAILGHLDVVGSGEVTDWTVPPFSGTLVDNRLYGRGAQDMKVPMVIILHVLKKLLREGHVFNKGVRLIIGSDEECGFRCMQAYAEKFAFPPVGFTPDGEFGIGHIETSLIEYDVYADESLDFEMWGGVGYNTVPDRAYYRGPKVAAVALHCQQAGIPFTLEADKLCVFGQATHVCEIETGINALQQLAAVLVAVGHKAKMLTYVTTGFGLTTNSEPINGPLSDQFCGALASNIGVMSLKSGAQHVSVDLRIPILVDEKLLLQLHRDFAHQYGFRFEVYFNDRKLYVNPQQHFIQTLAQSYEAIIGQPCSFLASRGGSYAKVAPNYVAFGALLSAAGEQSVVHQVDEYYDFTYLEPVFAIYYEAIRALTS